MKIIISHDVDHLYSTDHIFRDLIFPKMWIRSLLHVLYKNIKIKTLCYRILSVFKRRMNRIDEVMKIDKQYNVPSVFFFGMNQGLGMSYKIKEVMPVIGMVKKNGFDVGVHGIAYEEIKDIEREYSDFLRIVRDKEFGIRTHYVRFNRDTFIKFSQVGYYFDSSDFNKEHLELKYPYKVNGMWEFPLHIMDGYIMPPGDLERGKINTINAINQAEKLNVPYLTILFHDYQYNEKTYPAEKAWYDWLLKYLADSGYEFTSYKDAINELEMR